MRWAAILFALALLAGCGGGDDDQPAGDSGGGKAETTRVEVIESSGQEGGFDPKAIYESEAPGVNVRMVPLTTRDPRELLESGSADLAVGHFPGVIAELTAIHLQEHSPRFLHQRLYDGEYVVVMRRDHPLATKPLTLDAYCAARHLLVSFSGRPFGFVDEALSAMSRQRRVVITVNQFFTAGRVVASTDLLTVLPRHFVEVTGIESALTLRELPLPVPAVHVDALWHRQSAHNGAHRWLRQAVERAARLGFADAVAAVAPTIAP